VSLGILHRCFESLTLSQTLGPSALGACFCPSSSFRRSEIVSSNGSNFAWFAPRTEDVIVINSAGSKTNQLGPPVTRMLKRSGDPVLCQVLGALLLHRAHGDLPTNVPIAVYKTSTASCISKVDITHPLRSAATNLGLHAQNFSPHSLRSGGATAFSGQAPIALPSNFTDAWLRMC
ncbi:TPA: hypothetical protein N0F65_009505, partial [Lagenidium giganteum]